MSPIRRLLLSILLVTLASCAIGAGFWQLSRLHQRRIANRAILAGRDLPPLDLQTALMTYDSLDGRKVTALGQFIPGKQLLLRGRVQNEVPGLHVVSAFAVSGTNTIIWVLRGFVASPDAVTPPSEIPPPTYGELTITGLMLPIPVTTDSGQPLAVGHDTTWRRMDREVLAKRFPGSHFEYVHLEGDRTGPGKLPTVPPPNVDEGPHMSYAIQWFGIAAAMIVFAWIMVWKKNGDAG